MSKVKVVWWTSLACIDSADLSNFFLLILLIWQLVLFLHSCVVLAKWTSFPLQRVHTHSYNMSALDSFHGTIDSKKGLYHLSYYNQYWRIGTIQKVCHRPRGEGVKQNSDKEWQGGSGVNPKSDVTADEKNLWQFSKLLIFCW